MPRKKNKGAKSNKGLNESSVCKMVEKRLQQGLGASDWIKQHKMQQRTIKVQQAYTVFPSVLSGGGYASAQPFYISANGFSYVNQSGILVGLKTPQEALLDLSFKAFVYYEVMDIGIEFVPVRAQIALTSDGILTAMYQNPTVSNNVPQLNQVAVGMPPTKDVTDIQKYQESLTARRGSRITEGLKTVSWKMQLPSNLLQRQSTPMLQTNASVTGRELYNNDDLNYLVILPYIAPDLGRTPYGVIRTSMTIRLAGRINPDSPNADAPLMAQQNLLAMLQPKGDGQSELPNDVLNALGDPSSDLFQLLQRYQAQRNSVSTGSQQSRPNSAK